MKEEREEKKRRESGEYQDPRLQVYFQILVSSYLFYHQSNWNLSWWKRLNSRYILALQHYECKTIHRWVWFLWIPGGSRDGQDQHSPSSVWRPLPGNKTNILIDSPGNIPRLGLPEKVPKTLLVMVTRVSTLATSPRRSWRMRSKQGQSCWTLLGKLLIFSSNRVKNWLIEFGQYSNVAPLNYIKTVLLLTRPLCYGVVWYFQQTLITLHLQAQHRVTTKGEQRAGEMKIQSWIFIDTYF